MNLISVYLLDYRILNKRFYFELKFAFALQVSHTERNFTKQLEKYVNLYNLAI
jgi:hypothetical protein